MSSGEQTTKNIKKIGSEMPKTIAGSGLHFSGDPNNCIKSHPSPCNVVTVTPGITEKKPSAPVVWSQTAQKTQKILPKNVAGSGSAPTPTLA